MFAITLLTSSTAWASAFTILDVQYEVWVRLVYPEYSYLQDSHLTSSSPLFARVVDTVWPTEFPGVFSEDYSFAQAIASGPYVGVGVLQPGSLTPYAAALAVSTITFAPTFDGYGKEVLMYGERPAESGFTPCCTMANWSITDVTTNTAVSLGYLGLGELSQPLAPYAWDSTHTYQMQLHVDTGSNNGPDSGHLGTNLFAQNVPDHPHTILLLLCGFAVTVVLRNRWSASPSSRIP